MNLDKAISFLLWALLAVFAFMLAASGLNVLAYGAVDFHLVQIADWEIAGWIYCQFSVIELSIFMGCLIAFHFNKQRALLVWIVSQFLVFQICILAVAIQYAHDNQVILINGVRVSGKPPFQGPAKR